MSNPEFRELSSIEESAIEHVPSSGSVLCVLLIHLNSPDKILFSRSCFSSGTFSSTSDSRTNFLVSGVDPELADSSHYSSPRTNFFALGSVQPSHFPYPGLQRLLFSFVYRTPVLSVCMMCLSRRFGLSRTLVAEL